MTKHTLHECTGQCDSPGSCNYCDGGLALCTTCGGAEGELPTECPGRKMGEDERGAVYNGTLDFISGIWVRK